MSSLQLKKLTAEYVRDSAIQAITDYSYDKTDADGNVIQSYAGIEGFFSSMAEGSAPERIAFLNFVKTIMVAEMKIADNQNARASGLMFSMELK